MTRLTDPEAPEVQSGIRRPPGRGYELIRYERDDLRDDVVAETAAVLGLEYADAVDCVERVLGLYPRGYPQGMPRPIAQMVVHISQPIRIPQMTSRMDGVLALLEKRTDLATVLDYGGGGGKDSIVYSRAGYRVTWADFVSELTPYVRRRFELRRLSVEMYDVEDLPEQRYDIVHCVDVIEHIYDVEDAVARMVSRLRPGGIFVCYPAFFNTWNGDHVEKNCGYLPFFLPLLERIGLTHLGRMPPRKARLRLARAFGLWSEELPVLLMSRHRPACDPAETERQQLRRELYEYSKAASTREAARRALALPMILASSLVLPSARLRARARASRERVLGELADDVAIRRLSRHRLEESEV